MKLLLVDDDISSVSALTNLLTFEHTLKIASNGIEALDIVGKSEFDAVITDLKMPKMNGIEMVRRLRMMGKHLPVIMITGYSNPEYLDAARTHDVTAFFTKPIEVGRFMDTLKQIEAGLPGC